jgi:uncharacterized protein YraI
VKKFSCFLLSLLFLTGLSFAETGVVKRNVTLRPDPSTDNEAVTILVPGQRLTLISLRKTNGYLHVTFKDKRGWVWARNVDIDESSADETEDHSTDATRGKHQVASSEATDTCGANTESFKHVGPNALYPDPMKTPGCAATLDVDDLTKTWTENCPGGKDSCTYSEAHRQVSKGERTFIYDEYSVPSTKRNIDNGEIDHFYPLCAGGSNSPSNLWYQPIENEWNGRNFGFKEKDKLEAWICRQIKAHKLDPQEAFDRLARDWVKFYIEELSTEDELKEQIKDDED